jgi:ABC-2 type transport system permease protein
MLHRLLTLVIKELQLSFRDPQSRRLLVLPVVIQLLVFPFAASLEVRNATLAILNEDTGGEAVELIERLARTEAFPHIRMVHSQPALTAAIDNQDALLGLDIPADFSRRLTTAGTAGLYAIVDGRRSNSAQIAYGYAAAVIDEYAAQRTTAGSATGALAGAAAGASRIVVRNVYNPDLEYRWFMLPVLVAIITTLGAMIVTALSIAREREQGTFDQLLVSPLTPAYIMAGKTLPALLIAMLQGTIVAAAAIFVYGVPFRGSMLLLYACMACYGLSLAGIGLFISSLCETQQQAFLGVFTFMVPAITLSGFMAPIENMPPVFRWLSAADPLSHFIVIVKGLFLKGYGPGLIWPHLWPLLGIAAVTMAGSYAMFRRRVA